MLRGEQREHVVGSCACAPRVWAPALAAERRSSRCRASRDGSTRSSKRDRARRAAARRNAAIVRNVGSLIPAVMVPAFSDFQFKDTFRMSRRAFAELVLRIRGDDAFAHSGVEVYIQLECALFRFCAGTSVRIAARYFGLSDGCADQCCHRIVYALYRNVSQCGPLCAFLASCPQRPRSRTTRSSETR